MEQTTTVSVLSATTETLQPTAQFRWRGGVLEQAFHCVSGYGMEIAMRTRWIAVPTVPDDTP
jgi:hypothetical protein